MPFVQRIVQPTYLARPRPAEANGTVSGVTKFHCIPGKCNNNNCINQAQQQQTPQSEQQSPTKEREAKENGWNDVARTTTIEKSNKKQQHSQQLPKTITTAVVHQHTDARAISNGSEDAPDFVVAHLSLNIKTHTPSHSHKHTNGFASSFSYATDTEEEPFLSNATDVGGEASALLPMKKLKQHVEFLSATSPSSSPARSGLNAAGSSTLATSDSSQVARLSQRQRQQKQLNSPTATKIITGYEFDSISNITLSNALRQLASLVLLASDIFDELQQELENVGDRSRAVQRKITMVEQKVCAFDPKMVTVPESDLLTFAQRKTHYESDKSARKELFTAETRPHSVKVLYEDAGKSSPPSTLASTSPRSTSFAYDTYDGLDDVSCTGASQAAGSDELVCTPVFGKANRKMRTRIDAEIEIRLPAAIEDLRKWTSSEALGDVTVTPDCMHHVDTSISTSVVIGDNGILTPALSPSVLSADAVDALYSINISNTHDNTQIPNDINKDVPLNHRLPSPEEQCKIIALRYPAEVISVDTSGKRFERMCLARKSTTGCVMNIADTNNLNEDVQTVSRRSRSRKVRGKRRNTIAGIDQKEIQDAANGDSTATSSEIKNTLAANNAETDAIAAEAEALLKPGTEKSKKFGRSKSSDILKKESVALPYDKGKSTLTRLNSLKQWGRNRFKFMQRTEANTTANGDASNNLQNNSAESRDETTISNGQKSSKTTSAGAGQIDDECVVRDLIGQKSEGRFSHERKPSYSSSEKSMSVSSSGHLKGKLHLATCGNNVKLRDTSSLNRQRRNGISANCLAGKDEQPHSSSGNWSASSESGRASIGSEITIQPKSSASNTSLNVSSFHPGSGPPSSMLSRRRFLNTSASSSVTSEGTATPDLQVPGDAYNNHLDDETSSAYSCDTEGYYTSFHMDSGLRTLKEEEPPMMPLQHAQTSNYSFGSQSNQTVLNAENEYELYGRGSTSTTTSSAGTVCTTLMANEQNSLNAVLGPDVPERSSSLLSGGGTGNGKLSRSSHSNSASSSTLERSYSSSTIGSTLERTGTIKRNVNSSPLKIASASDEVDVANERLLATETPESQEDEFDFEQSVRKRAAQPLPTSSVVADLEFSESSDLEGVERIERIKQKTAINAKRIPSMCIITPSTSDDENHARDAEAYDPNRTLTNESSPCTKAQTALRSTNVNEISGYCTVDVSGVPNTAEENMLTPQSKDHNLNLLAKRGSHYGLNNMLEKLKVVLPNIKRSPNKNSVQSSVNVIDDDELYDTAGEYVTIADISNNNRQNRLAQPKSTSGLGIYYSNDIVRRKLAVASADESASQANEPNSTSDSESNKPEPLPEYISLNELPYHLRKIATNNGTDNKEAINVAAPTITHLPNGLRECADSNSSQSIPMYAEITEQRERPLISPVTQNKGAQRVKLNAQGRAIYDSDSLKRRKGAHTTFAPGPYVKETESALAETNTVTVGAELSALHKNSESGHNARTNNAKLIFLNGSGSGLTGPTRKVANVKPLVATNKNLETMSSTPITSALIGPNTRHQYTPVVYSSGGDDGYVENKNLLANNTNPFFQATGMMPSPSNKSTSSTGSSTISTTNSTHTQASTASSSSSSSYSKSSSSTISAKDEEGYQLLRKPSELQTAATTAMPFQRNGPVYWTLQNRKQPRNVPPTVATCRDDLYATPIRRSERTARAAAIAAAANTAASISPIVPRNRSSSVGFLTSTPTKVDSQLPINNSASKQAASRQMNWNDDSPERLNICADRIGQSKTSLMDFKKLLLAKSVKSSPVQKKVSAVELLKKTSAGATLASDNSNRNSNENNGSLTPPLQSVNAVNTSMKVLDLSGSPKTFASRRMLRHGQFGSPSKSFAPKPRSSPGGWRNNVVQRTDIMSTTIPEVNSEEDQSSANSSSSKSLSTTESAVEVEERLQQSAAEKFNLKRNFFLQTEENNFMKGELKKPFAKTNLMSTSLGTTSLVNSANNLSAPLCESTNYGTTAIVGSLNANRKELDTLGSPIGRSMPALETAL